MAVQVTKELACGRSSNPANGTGIRFKIIYILIIGLSMILLGGCAGSVEQFAEGLRVMSGKGGTKEKIDTFPAIKRQAKEILKSNPAPDWQIKFRADAADVFELLPGNRLLLGEVNVSSAIAEPEYGDLALYDLNKGKRVWIAKRRDLEWGRYDLLAQQDDLLLMQGSSPKGGFYQALNIRNGQTVWEYEVKPSMHTAYEAATHRFYLLDVAKREMLSLDSRSGKISWRLGLAGVKQDSNILLMPERNSLIVLAGALYKLSKRGTISWKRALPVEFKNHKEVNLRITSRGILLFDKRFMALLNAQSGKLVWGPVPLSGRSYETIKLLSAPLASTRIFAWSSRDKVVSLNLRNGTRQWVYAFDKEDGTTLQSPIFYANNKVYFTTYNSLTVLDAKTGHRLTRIAFPFLESGLFSSLTPDMFLVRKNKIFLLREGGAVYAVSARSNKQLWKQVVNWKYQMYFNTTLINQALKKSLTDKAYAEKLAKETSLWWSAHNSAMEYQSRYYTSLGQRKSSSSSDYGQIGSKGLIDTRSFDASMLFFQASLGFSDTVEKSIKAAAQEGLAERLNMELTNAIKNHLRSVQHGYFIRPYDSAKGMVVMLVNLDSGKRYDLFYSPSNIGMRYIDMRLPAFIIGPAGKYLYTTEIGGDTGKYERYVKFKYGMPYPSVLRFKLSDLGFAGK